MIRRVLRQTPGFVAGVVVTAAAVGAPLALAAAGPADGPGGDRTAPALTVAGDQGFAVGGQLDQVTASQADHCDSRIYHFAIPVRRTLTASDAGGSGLAWTSVVPDYPYETPLRLSPPTVWTTTTTDMVAPPCGGGGPRDLPYLFTAADGAGNRSVVGPVRFGLVTTVQEDGTSASGGFPVTVKRWGGVTSVASTGASGGRTFTTSTLGSGVEYGVTTRAGQHLALVMPTGPTRGRVDVRVDGAVVARVDTYAATARDRVVVWETALGAGAHTVSVTCLGTSGRPRIDVDEVLLTA